MIIDDKEIIVTGKLLKIAELKEDWDEDIDNPNRFAEELITHNIRADLFSFIQRLPESKPKFNYFMDWDSVAAIPVVSYDYWLKNQVTKNSRKKIGLAKRKGVVVRRCEFNDDFVKGILDIYHESPIMQGKPNRQYNTDFKTAQKLNSTFLERAQFIGAFYKDEMIGYIKLVDAGKYVRTMGILSKKKHRDKAPMNYLIAKSVKICAERKVPYITYSKYNYGKRGSETLKIFKKNLGFESIIVPRYYLPLTDWGRMVLKLKIHQGLFEFLPKSMIQQLQKIRAEKYAKMYRHISI